jgi:dipeptidyl-peptidase-3
LGLLALLVALSLAWSGCAKKEIQKKGLVGEIERLGKEGQDYLVVGVDAPGFEELTPNQRKFAYYMYRAAIAGNDIMTDQSHRDALEIKNLLEQIYLNRDGIDEETQTAVLDYLKYIWINHGQYDHYNHTKFTPNYLTPEMLRQAAQKAMENGAEIELRDGETLEDKLARLEPSIFDPNFEPIQVNQHEGVDIIAESAVNLYDPGVTLRDLQRLPQFWQSKLNVRFAKVDGKVVPQEYKIGGVYSEYLENIVYWLEKAVPLAESEEQARGLRALIDFYKTGDEQLFREYSILWLRSNTVMDYLNGFIEQYKDPRGVIGQFEANVSYVADSRLLDSLATYALYFEKKMPWPDKYKRDKIEKPVANVVNVLVETGDSGPISPAAYNLPNYSDIRRDYGSKNIILLNIQEAGSEKIRDAIINEFYLPQYRDLVKKYGRTGRTWIVYMHEVIGHGSGKPEEGLREDPRVLIGRAYNALEESRADLVALYHIFDDKLVDIGAFKKSEQKDVILATYLRYLQGFLTQYRTIEDDVVREAHYRGRQLVLSYLTEGGENGDKDYGVRVIQKDGNYYVEITDVNKAREGVGEILARLQTLKATGDGAGAAAFFDRFGTKINPEWRDNIHQRAEKVAIPRHTAFVFPRLIPVRGGENNDELVDVEIAFDEDLTAQQLRFSRLAFSRDLFEEAEPAEPAQVAYRAVAGGQ